MEELSWVLELVNMVSGPARAIQASLKSTQSAAASLQKTTAASAGPASFGSAYKSSFAGIEKGAGAATSSIDKVGSSLGSAAMQLGAFAGAAALAAAAWGAKKLGEEALHAVAYKENALIALRVMLKSREEAARVYKEAEAFAAVTPFSTQDVIGLYQQLVTAGFSAKKGASGKSEVQVLSETIGNVAAAKGMDPEVISRLAQVFAKIKGEGKLTGHDLNQLGTMGVGRGEITAELAKQLGKTTEQINKMLTKGQIDSTTSIVAVTEVIGRTFGGLMKEQSKTLTGLWSTLASRPFELLSNLDLDAFTPLKEFMDVLGNMMSPDSPTAMDIKGFLNTVIKGFFHTLLFWAEDASGHITESSLKEGFHKIGEAISAVWAKAKVLIDVTVKLATTFLGLFTEVSSGQGALSAVLTILGQFADWALILLQVAGYVGQLGLAFNQLEIWILQFLAAIPGALVSALEWIGTEAYNLGAAIVSGIVTGIESGAVAIKDSVVGAVGNAYHGAKSYLGIASPSKLFAGMGQNVALGMAVGIDRGAGAVSRAALGMMPSVAGGFAMPGAGAGGVGNSGGAPSINVTVNVNGGASPEETAKLVKQAALESISEALEEMGFEMGLAPQ